MIVASDSKSLDTVVDRCPPDWSRHRAKRRSSVSTSRSDRSGSTVKVTPSVQCPRIFRRQAVVPRAVQTKMSIVNHRLVRHHGQPLGESSRLQTRLSASSRSSERSKFKESGGWVEVSGRAWPSRFANNSSTAGGIGRVLCWYKVLLNLIES